MIYEIIIAIILVIAFFMCIAAYMLGFKHAKLLQKGNIPDVILNPIKAIHEHKEKVETRKIEEVIKKTQKKESEGWLNILSFDGTPQKEDEE